MKLEECINFLLTKTQQKVHQLAKARFAPYHVTPVQYMVLYKLWEQDEQSISDLSEKVHLDTSTMTGVLDRLEKNILVERKPSQNDRRVNLICLTVGGKQLETVLRKEMEEVNKIVLNQFTESDALLLKKFLRGISDSKVKF
jgi:DNA-binding MarR family transcriptional regulator